MFSRTPSPAKASASSTLKLPASSTCPLVFLIQTARSGGEFSSHSVTFSCLDVILKNGHQCRLISRDRDLLFNVVFEEVAGGFALGLGGLLTSDTHKRGGLRKHVCCAGLNLNSFGGRSNLQGRIDLICTADAQIEVAQVVALETWGAYEERGVTRLNIAEAVMAARVRCRHLRCTGFLIANRHASAWNDRSGGILHDSLQAAKHASGTQRTGGAATHVSAQSARRNRFSHLQRRLVRLRCQHH